VIPALSSQIILSASLVGTVQTRDSLEAVYGATVTLVNERLQTWQSPSGLQGGFAFDSLPAGTYRLHVEAPQDVNLVGRFVDAGELCDAQSWSLSEDESLTDVQVLLHSGGTLEGRLLDLDGQPVADSPVWAIGTSDSTEGRTRSSRTDAEGYFLLQGLAGKNLESGQWLVWMDSENWPSQYLGESYGPDLADEYLAGPGADLDVGAHTVLAGITVEGTVMGPSSPVAAATVHVYAGGQVVTVESDSDGYYRATALPPGDVLPWASAEGLATTYYPDFDRPTEFLLMEEEGGLLSGADLSLPAEAFFEAMVVTESTGLPVPGVSALLYNDTHTVGRGDQADSDGVLRLDRLHPGTYELYVWGSSQGLVDDWVRDETGSVRVLEVGPGAEAVHVSLPSASILEGRVLDIDGRPIGSAWVIAEPEVGNTEATLTDSDGVFSLSGLNEQSWSLEARVSSACPGDPAYVSTWWPEQVNEDWAPRINLSNGDQEQGLEIWMPYDIDHDGMGDGWENTWNLDPTINDASEDPDGDGYLNLTEYLLNTNPRSDLRGCRAAPTQPAVSLFALALPLLVRRRR
jgi:hypothetical protein